MVHRERPTSNLFTNFENLGDGDTVALDPADFRPLAIKLDCSGHNSSNILRRGKSHDSLLITFNDNCTPILEVDEGV